MRALHLVLSGLVNHRSPSPLLSSQELCSCQTVILSVDDEAGQRIIIEDLLEATRGSDAGLRQAAVTMLNGYFARTRLDYSAHTRTLLSGLIRLLNDANPEVLQQSWDTINSITKVSAPPGANVAQHTDENRLFCSTVLTMRLR